MGASDGYLVNHNPHDYEGYYFFFKELIFLVSSSSNIPIHFFHS